MTRRDYCPVCNEMVGDYDVMCSKCYVSLCHYCATTYDGKSRIRIINARFKVKSKQTISLGELKQYYEDLKEEMTPEFVENLRELSDSDDNDNDNYDIYDDLSYYKMYEISLNEIEKIINSHEDNKNLNEQISDTRLNKCIDNICLCINDCELIDFVCLMCHKGIKVTY